MNIDYIIERRKELCALSPSPKAYVNVHAFDRNVEFSVFFYPYGDGPHCVTVLASDASLEEAFAKATIKWRVVSDEHNGKRVIAMAQFIAKHLVTYALVTDVDLRTEGFHDSEIASLGERACALAAEAANKHPITITKIEGANGAPHGGGSDIPF